MKPGDVLCLPNAPKQNGDLWIKVNEDNRVYVMNPAGKWWRDRSFTVGEFVKLWGKLKNEMVC